MFLLFLFPFPGLLFFFTCAHPIARLDFELSRSSYSLHACVLAPPGRIVSLFLRSTSFLPAHRSSTHRYPYLHIYLYTHTTRIIPPLLTCHVLTMPVLPYHLPSCIFRLPLYTSPNVVELVLSSLSFFVPLLFRFPLFLVSDSPLFCLQSIRSSSFRHHPNALLAYLARASSGLSSSFLQSFLVFVLVNSYARRFLSYIPLLDVDVDV